MFLCWMQETHFLVASLLSEPNSLPSSRKQPFRHLNTAIGIFWLNIVVVILIIPIIIARSDSQLSHTFSCTVLSLHLALLSPLSLQDFCMPRPSECFWSYHSELKSDAPSSEMLCLTFLRETELPSRHLTLPTPDSLHHINLRFKNGTYNCLKLPGVWPHLFMFADNF